MASTSLTEAQRETLALFEVSGEPRTTSEVATCLDLGRRGAYDRLERLVDHGRLETKKVGGNGRVWWRPSANTDTTPDWSAAAESLIDDVLDSTEVGIFVLDEDFEIAWINDATERYFGLDRERVLGRDKRRLVEEQIASVVDESEEFTETVLATYDDNSDTEQFECRVMPDEDREERWLEHRSEPIDAGAYAGGRVELYYDITNRKQVKQAHDRDRTQFESIIDAVEEYAIFMLDPDGSVRTWNQGAERMKGYTAEEILGEHFARFYIDEAREAGVPQENLAAASEHGSVQEEGWRLRADGSRFWANVTITAIRGDDGEIDGYVKITRDMTERRKNNQELRRERNLLEQVREASPIGIAIFDTDGDLQRANQRFLELLGQDNAEPLNYSLGEQPPLDADGNVIPYPERPAPRALSTGEPVIDQRMRIDGPDGRTRWLSVNAKPFDGETDGVVVTTTDVTQLKRQAQRLERQRDELQMELDEMFERIDDAFIALDDDLRFTYVNEQASTLLGPSSSELVGEYIWDALEPGPKAEAAFEEALETQESISFEEHYDPLDAWFETRVYPSEDGLSIYFQDITDRKERERELERYETIVETANDGIYVVDEDGYFVHVNERYESMVERSESELLGSHVSTVVDEEIVNEVKRLEEALVTGERTMATLEAELTTPDGETRIGEATFALIESGDTYERVGVVRDITERKEHERDLELYETIVSTMNDGVYVLDDEFCFEQVNDAYVEMTGYDREELLGTHYSIVVDDEVAAEFARQVEEILDDDTKGGALEADIHRADGTRLRAESNFTAISTEAGDGIKKIGVVRDVSDRVAHEQELERQRDQLQALNSLNEVAREITSAVIDQSTRDEIEATVCEYLAGSKSYQFAWIGDVDTGTQTVNLRTEAGVEGYLDGITISVDPDDERSDGPTGRALRTGETQVSHDVRAESRYDPWREHVEQYGFRSSAAVPIVHEGTVYGVINVYADRPYAFDGQERAVISQLGEVVGHAIAASERKQALLSDELVELDFEIRDVFAAVDAPVETSGTITLDQMVTVEDGEFLVYGTATEDALDTVHGLVEALPHWESVTVISEDELVRFELRAIDPPVLSEVASHGGYIDEAVIEDGDYRMTIHLAPTTDVRQITTAVEEVYPTAELLRRRQITRTDDQQLLQRRLIADLTDRQRATLEAAYHAGFFEWPRDSSGEEVADSLGVAPPTFHQHLRKAERKVFDTVFSSSVQSVA